ncbi:hypothetical protein DSO57_1031975 [Entomophthora muscae]|uniref:Uncharacterized protein n=1 Tax=Entomophthora muscae TaxID=34485 RepID=A0ACC2U9I7_9FUNG|nr:hypothetical protein DSO57_1031975 [Entomophthora muscae]
MTLTVDEKLYTRFAEFTISKSPTKRARKPLKRFQSMSGIQDIPKDIPEVASEAPKKGYEKVEDLNEKCQSRLRITPSLFSSLTSIFILVSHFFTLRKLGPQAFSIASFSQFSYVATTCYYAAFIYCSNFDRKLLKYLVAYFTFSINGCHWLVFWLVPTLNQPDNLIAHNLEFGLQTSAFLSLGTNTTLWYPILCWWLFQIVNRNVITLLVWEFEVLLTPAYTRLYRAFCLLSSAIFPFAWGFILDASIPQTLKAEAFSLLATDLSASPKLASSLLYSLVVSCVFFCWVSFLTFQYRGVVWKVPSTNGFLVFQDEEKSLLCELF